MIVVFLLLTGMLLGYILGRVDDNRDFKPAFLGILICWCVLGIVKLTLLCAAA